MISKKKINSEYIYLISDIHANLPLFKKAIQNIDLSKEYLFILGDIFEKGIYNMETIDYVQYLMETYKNHVFSLKGNCDAVLNEFHRPANKDRLMRYSLVLGKTILNEFLEGIGVDIHSNYDLDSKLDIINEKYKKYFDFVDNLDEGFLINDDILLTHADIYESEKKGLIDPKEFSKYNYSINIVGHIPTMMYKKAPNTAPLLKDNVLFIDGGNQVVDFGGLNLVKFNLKTKEYSYETFYDYPLVEVANDTISLGETYVPDKTKIDSFSPLADFYSVYINSKKLYVSKRNLVKEEYSYDAMNIFLGLKKGEKVYLAKKGEILSYIIKGNDAGLIYTKDLKVNE